MRPVPCDSPPLHEIDATSARAAIDRGDLTASSLVTACLARIAARDALIGAWAHVAGDAARQRAAARLAEKISDEEVASVNASLARSLAQLQVKRRRRS